MLTFHDAVLWQARPATGRRQQVRVFIVLRDEGQNDV